jgi:hypothetical protein
MIQVTLRSIEANRGMKIAMFNASSDQRSPLAKKVLSFDSFSKKSRLHVVLHSRVTLDHDNALVALIKRTDLGKKMLAVGRLRASVIWNENKKVFYP